MYTITKETRFGPAGLRRGERMDQTMKRKYGKAAGVILALIMASGMLSACGTSAGAGTAETEETESQADGTKAAGMPAAGETAEEKEEADAGGQTGDGTDRETDGGGVSDDILSDPTLGGIFQTYTVQEYEEVVENVKKYASDGGGAGVKNMEEDLEKLKEDNGKGEFVVYKPAFEETLEENGYFIQSGFNPDIVMDPVHAYRSVPDQLTAENYEKEIASVTKTLDEAVSRGQLTQEQKEIILAKMNDNLAALK